MRDLFREKTDNYGKITHAFFTYLQTELMGGNPYLNEEERGRLRSHYPFMMNPNRYPTRLVSTIYASRRVHPVQTILVSRNPLVFDAGCGYGSDSLLFATVGAKVMAVDLSADGT